MLELFYFSFAQSCGRTAEQVPGGGTLNLDLNVMPGHHVPLLAALVCTHEQTKFAEECATDALKAHPYSETEQLPQQEHAGRAHSAIQVVGSQMASSATTQLLEANGTSKHGKRDWSYTIQ